MILSSLLLTWTTHTAQSLTHAAESTCSNNTLRILIIRFVVVVGIVANFRASFRYVDRSRLWRSLTSFEHEPHAADATAEDEDDDGM
jgi:hypothetical protein